MKEYSLSVVIPNYNNAKYISQCIESVAAQTYEIDEIIVVDDCSTDDSLEILQRLQLKYCNLVVHTLQENRGVSFARNKGVSLCKSTYVTFLDADDMCGDVHKLEYEMRLIKEHKEAGIDIAAYSKVVYMEEDGTPISSEQVHTAYNGHIFKPLLCTYTTVVIPRDFCVSTEIFTKAGGYREDMNLYEDYELTLRIAKNYAFYNTNEIGTCYRLKKTGLSAKSLKESDKVFVGLFWTYLKHLSLKDKLCCMILKLSGYIKYRLKPQIRDILRGIKAILKKTPVYRLKEYLRQKRCVILFRLILSNLFHEKKKTIGRKVINMQTYVKKANAAYQLFENEQERPIYLAPCFEKKTEEVKFVKTPEIYIAYVKKVNIIGCCGAIYTKKNCILDALANDTENRVDYVTPPICFFEKKKLYVKYKKRQPIEKGIMLCGVAPFNYYHFMIELMSRLETVERFVEDKTIPILVDAAAYQYPQLAELVDILNKFHRPVIKVENDIFYSVQELIYPSLQVWFPVNIQIGLKNRYQDFGMSMNALTNLRTEILKETPKVTGKRLYLARKEKQFSRLANEDEIEKLFEVYGFQAIYTQDYSFSEQVKMFSEAEAVAGVSGAAFANIVFCAPGTEIICIIPQEYQFYLYSTMAYLLKEQFTFLDAEVVKRGENPALSQFYLNLEYCRRFLKKFE